MVILRQTMRDLRASQYSTRQTKPHKKAGKEVLMKTLSFRIVQLIAVLALVTGVAILATRSSRGQSPAAINEPQQKTEPPTQKAETLVKPTVMTTDRAPVNTDRKSTRLNSSHIPLSRMPSSA